MQLKIFTLKKPLHLCTELPTRVIDIAKFIKDSIEEKVSTIENIEIIFEDKLVGDANQNYSSVNQLVSLKAPNIRRINQELINETVLWFLENIKNYNIFNLTTLYSYNSSDLEEFLVFISGFNLNLVNI